MPSPISAKDVLERLQGTGCDVPILPREDPRWERLRFEGDPEVDLRDRYRSAGWTVPLGTAWDGEGGGTPISNFGLRISNWRERPRRKHDTAEQIVDRAESLELRAERRPTAGGPLS